MGVGGLSICGLLTAHIENANEYDLFAAAIPEEGDDCDF